MENSHNHIPVFLKEAIQLLKLKNDGKYLDCTFGRGGHSSLILKNLNDKGFLWMIDCDEDSYKFYKDNFDYKKNLFIKDFFCNIKKIALKNEINNLDGILFDLGVSSPQLDNKSRGFSYHGSDYIDMRMDQNQKINAAWILKNYSREGLNKIFHKYGEIKNPTFVTNGIIKQREIKPIQLTSELVSIIKENVHTKELYTNKHPARKYFQAIRMEVNNELDQIKKALYDASDLLNTGGRIVVITFHSLEDKIVKNIFTDLSKSYIPREIPLMTDDRKFKIIQVKFKNKTEDILKNPRARSANIRCLEKL